ncbi:MAG: S46 family peptidase [Cytophagaceae bacterium]|jgi:hypothetical protein|nr:S46 family peptidase [Cytophagaceae bacterium]
MYRKILLTAVAVIMWLGAYAGEGMWLPLLIEKYNIDEMHAKGFKLSAEDIYSINKASMKDAVMIFGGGCTGELISDKGLLITNHHCGYPQIQSHSSVEHDYLTDGFWAMSADEELPNQGLKVTFLKRMEDVTIRVLNGVTDDMNMNERKAAISKNIAKIMEEAVEGTHYSGLVESFYYGNQYFLFVNEVFSDVRLVGAPPSSIGKFGGDSDNWTWPRHTGDFSLFRIYANKNNEPAEYSAENVPYRPAAHFPISLKGIEEGDFTMVFGYPGNTSEYAPSFHIEMLANFIYPKLVDIRTAKLNVMNRYMAADRGVRIQYASKNASIANAWKRWKGEIRGLAKMDVVSTKQAYEKRFDEWVNSSDDRKAKFGNIISDYENIYADYSQYRLVRDYLNEYIGGLGLETICISRRFERLLALYGDSNHDSETISTIKAMTEAQLQMHFKNLHLPLDKETATVVLEMLYQNIPSAFFPDITENINNKYKGNISKYIDEVYAKTFFISQQATLAFLNGFNSGSVKKLNSDPAYQLYKSLTDVYQQKVLPRYNELQNRLDSLNRIYMAALMQFDNERTFYPDANFTLRVAYGDVRGYEAGDAVRFLHFTTLEGIMQKENPDIYDYHVPERLKQLHAAKDYGRYELNGTIPVAFTATNHTTGGNSGSPILNARGELIGVNFDRAWEGVMSDLMFNPDQSRNISIDIRYALFIIDKYANAGYLLDEMTIVE